MNNLFAELKRRNVVRVAIAYLVAAWVLAQIGDLAADNLAFPEWFMPMLLVVLALGFPVALLLSWAFELTPEGVKKTGDVDPAQSQTRATGRKLNFAIIGVLVLGIGFLLYDRGLAPAGEGPEGISDMNRATIAVLPFVNMSNDPEQEFFSDGITEEILNILVKEKALKVVSRTSAFAIKGQGLDIPAIAERLGATYVVEGSVRRANNVLRITAQLIEAENDTHLWSETFDRSYEDVFAVQEEIAAAISRALGASLGFTASIAPGQVATRMDDLEAYDDFLRAKSKLRTRDIPGAIPLFESVVEREPDFAPAWSLYAASLSYLLDYGQELEIYRSGAHAFMMRRAVRRASALAPDDAETQYALAILASHEERVVDELDHYKQALAIDPDNALVLEDYLQALTNNLLYDQAIPVAERLRLADPLWSPALWQRGKLLAMTGNVDEAILIFRKVALAHPEWGVSHWFFIRWLIEAGRWDEAIAAQAVAREALGDTPLSLPGVVNADLVAMRAWVEDPERPRLRDSGWVAASGSFLTTGPMQSAILASGNMDDMFVLAGFLQPVGALSLLATFGRIPDLRALWSDPRTKGLILGLERRWDHSLPDLWRAYGWPEFCRPLGEDDFECGVFE